MISGGHRTEEARSEAPAPHLVSGVNGQRHELSQGAEPIRICRAMYCGRKPWRHALCRTHYPDSAAAAPGYLWVECWCGASKVEIRQEWIGVAGGSCGREVCRALVG